MSNFIQVTPFMHVRDFERALGFFTDILGFELRSRTGNYAYVRRESVAFRILEQTGPEGAPPGNRRFAYYIDVHNVDALHEELKPKLGTLPKGDEWPARTAGAGAGRQPDRVQAGYQAEVRAERRAGAYCGTTYFLWQPRQAAASVWSAGT